ncbi:T9SS type A sorting domain-containing protein [Lacinutrix salivirga]
MKTKLHLTAFFISALLFSINTNAQTTLASGDVAVIYHLSETSTTPEGTTANIDRIGLVLLTDIATGTTFKVTENGSNNGSTLELDEGVIIFTAQTDLTAGTVIDLVSKDQLNQGRTSNIPLITDGNSPTGYAVSTAGDQTIVYTGPEFAPTFIYSAFFDGTSWDDVAACAGNCSGTESVEPSSGITFAFGATPNSEFDNSWYTGPTTFATPAEALTAITNIANWTGENSNAGTGEVAGDAMVASGFTFTTLSVNFNQLDALALYPNPSNGVINIRNNGISLEELHITDLNGRKIETINLKGTTANVTLDLTSEISSGLYFVSIVSKKGTVTKKLIIE